MNDRHHICIFLDLKIVKQNIVFLFNIGKMDLTVNKNQTNNEILFQNAVTQAFEKIAESVSEEEFQKIFVILSSKKSTSRKLANIFIDELKKSMNSTLEEICKEDSLTEGFAKLASLTEETITPTNTKVWRPPGDVKLHLRSCDAKAILEECQVLEKKIFEINEKNNEKIKEVMNNRKKINEVQEKTSQLLNRSKFSVSYMQQMIGAIEDHINTIDQIE